MSESRQAISLFEYATCPEPVALAPEIAQTIREQLGHYLDIAPVWGQAGRYWVTARQFVGDILIRDVHIRIRSAKAPLVNLFWMLTFAYDLPQFRDQTIEFEEQDILFRFLVAIFVNQVERLIRHGLLHSYQLLRGNRARLKGKLEVAQQLRQGLVHPERFAVRWSEHTRDVPENRLLKHVLLALASARYPGQSTLGSRLRSAYAAFDGVQYAPITVHDFDALKYNRLNDRYRKPLALGRLLWEHLGLRNEVGQVSFATYLFDLNVLFERFVVAYLRQALAGSRLRVKPQYGATLDQEHKERAEMDLVLFEGERPALVLDTKYKTYQDKPARGDLNQIFAYCHTLGIDRGVLLYPSTTRIVDRRSMSGARIEIRSVSLGGNPEQIEGHMTDLVHELDALAVSSGAPRPTRQFDG